MNRQEEKLAMRTRRRLIDQAIAYSTANRWEDAVDVNQKLLQFGEDADTLNRLGKAYMELGRYMEAHEAYQRALTLSPSNTIARRYVARLDQLLGANVLEEPERTVQSEPLDMRLFITETGKACITTLVELDDHLIVARLSAGDRLELEQRESLVAVKTISGELVGNLEPRLSQRLRELLEAGNRYIGAVVQLDGTVIKVLIRETYQHISMHGKLSFPGKLGGDLASFRPYVRDLGRYDYDIEEDMEDHDDDDDIEEGFGNEEEVGLEEVETDIDDDVDEE